MGFWAGFAKGWEAESERIERRKLFQQELNEKRVGTLAELVTRMGRSSTAGSGLGDDATPGTSSPSSAQHYEKVLLNYGMEQDDIARLASEGGVYGLEAAVKTIQEYNTPENPFTPEHFKRLPDSIIVTQGEAGARVDPKTVAEQLWGPDFWAEIDPADQKILELTAAGSAPAPSVTSTFLPDEPIRQDVANQIVDSANETLMADLTDYADQAMAELSQVEPGSEEYARVAQRAEQAQAALEALEAGNINPGIALVGAEVIGPYLENNPRLKENPGLLGPWKGAAEAYLNPPDQTAEAFSTPKEYPDLESVQADIDAGLLQEGDVVIINGREVPIQFGD